MIFKLSFFIPSRLMKIRSIHSQKESIAGVNTTNTYTKKKKNPNTDIKHKDPIIPIFYAEHFRECFDKVCRRELLDKCKRGATQNTNESFHSVMWNIARKTLFFYLTTLKLAVGLTVAKYNFGYVSVLSRCLVAVTGQEAVSSRAMASYSGLDRDRIELSARMMSEIHKKRRKYLAFLRSRQEKAAIEEEGGMSYAPALDEDRKD